MRTDEFERQFRDATAAGDPDDVFVTYKQLDDHGIPKLSRVHLRRLMKAGLFPKAVYLTPGRCAWRLSELRAWKASRAPAASAA